MTRKHNFIKLGFFVLIVVYLLPFRSFAQGLNEDALKKGMDFLHNGKYDEAITEFNKVIQTNSTDSAEAFYNRADVYRLKNNYDQAISDLTNAIELKSNYAKAYFGRGCIYDQKSKYDQAIADYTKAIELDPKYAGIYYNRGIDYVNESNYDQAILDFTKAVELNPKKIKY